MKRTRRNHGATFKAQVALAVVKGDKTLAELAEQVSVRPTQITEWKQQLLARAANVKRMSGETAIRSVYGLLLTSSRGSRAVAT